MLAAPPVDRAAVRDIVDSSLVSLKEWLDGRLQLQKEEILRSLSNVQALHSSDNNVGTTLATQNAAQPASKPEGMPCPIAQPRPSEDKRCIRSSTESSTAESIATSMAPTYKNGEQIWLSSLMEVFEQLDWRKTGCIEKEGFKEAATELGIGVEQAMTVFECMDKSNNGVIERMEWFHGISGRVTDDRADASHVTHFLSLLVDLQISRGFIFAVERSHWRRLIIRHESWVRVTWDLAILISLLYISLFVPYSLAFGADRILNFMERVTDVFCCDVLMNFRTSYRNKANALIVDGRKIAIRYLKSWFLLDLVSSIPFDMFSEGVLPNLSPVRLLKVWVISKAVKLLRLVKILSESMLVEKLTRKLHGRNLGMLLKLATVAFLTSHWLACFANILDDTALDNYFNVLNQQPHKRQKYLAALYWAVTTISTVGYGDVTPFSDTERAFAMVAMVVGGTLYAYIIGSVTTILTHIDTESQKYQEQMILIQSWLKSHKHLPKSLRMSIGKNVSEALLAETVITDSSVLDYLSPELRNDAAFFILSDYVRHNPMFLNLPRNALPELVEILHEIYASKDEIIVQKDHPGIRMYILVQGLARYEEGCRWHPPASKGPISTHQHLVEGESFGEEILFGLEEKYKYTVMTIPDSMFHWISEDAFVENYKNMPDLHGQMYASFLRSRGWSDNAAKTTARLAL